MVIILFPGWSLWSWPAALDLGTTSSEQLSDLYVGYNIKVTNYNHTYCDVANNWTRIENWVWSLIIQKKQALVAFLKAEHLNNTHMRSVEPAAWTGYVGLFGIVPIAKIKMSIEQLGYSNPHSLCCDCISGK